MNASDHAPAGQSDVLRSAWKRMTEMDLQSSKISKQSTQLRKWIAILGVVATFLAIITNELRGEVIDVVEQILRGLLILVPIIISFTAAYNNKFFGGANGLVMRAGSEEIKKEIYLYRTVLRNHPDRDRWLSRRMTTIQRRTYKSLGGELIIEAYEGKLPMYYNPDDPNSDPGFSDLTGDEYMRYRVIDQRDWHRRKNVQLKEERKRIQAISLAMGGVGALLAAIPPEWTPGWGLASWVAFTSAIASAYTGWEQLRGLDKILTIYSRVILELTIIRDEWEAIAPHQRTEVDFIKMVRDAEDVMWAQNMQYISTMQEAITAGQGDEAELVENMLKEGESVTSELQAKLLEEAKGVLSHASAELGKVVEESAATVKAMVNTAAEAASDLQAQAAGAFEGETQAFGEMVDTGLERVTTETAAIRTTVSQTVETAMDEVAATREMVDSATQEVAVEAAELRGAAAHTLDAALAETAATRAAWETTAEVLTTQAGAIRETVQLTEPMTVLSEKAAEVREAVETSVAGVSEVKAETDEIRGIMEEKISKELKKQKKENTPMISAKLDAMLDEAAEVIESTAETMRGKMVEEVAEQIADLATDKKKVKK